VDSDSDDVAYSHISVALISISISLRIDYCTTTDLWLSIYSATMLWIYVSVSILTAKRVTASVPVLWFWTLFSISTLPQTEALAPVLYTEYTADGVIAEHWHFRV